METRKFFFDLPPKLIAQAPMEHRDKSRLMLVKRKSSELRHSSVKKLPNLIPRGAVMVFNNSKVIPARLEGIDSNGKSTQFLLLKHEGRRMKWQVLTPNVNRMGSGKKFLFPDNVKGVLTKVSPGKELWLIFNTEIDYDYLEQNGQVPLPPYINRSVSPIDKERYQTVYAEKSGSIAAPTAGIFLLEPKFAKRLSYLPP